VFTFILNNTCRCTQSLWSNKA